MKIEKDIPIPEVTGGRGRKLLYPWNQMQAGDSFVVPLKEAYAARQSLAQYKLRHKNNVGEFTSRTVGSKVRFWRVK